MIFKYPHLCDVKIYSQMNRHMRKISVKMKTPIIFFVATITCLTLLFMGCDSPAQKVVNAENNVTEANQELSEAKEAYLTDLENYRNEVSNRIEANNKSIEEFNARIAKEKKDTRATYAAKIAELEQKNSDMKLKINEYRAEGKEQWLSFKEGFNKDMDDLSKKLSEMTDKK